jgi:hypothetical protein
MSPRKHTQGSPPNTTGTTPAAGVLHDETSALAHGAAEPLPSDQFTLVDRDFCAWVAAGFEHKKSQDSARSWRELAAKIERVLVGEYAQFTKLDRDLVVALHLVALKHVGTPGARETRRGCGRLGVLVQWAVQGNLEQLRSSGAR